MHLLKIEKLKHNIIVKAIFVLILIAFIWTFSDYSYLNGNNIIAKVGNEEITKKDLTLAYENAFTPEMKSMANNQEFMEYFKTAVFQNLVNEKLEISLAKKLGFNVPKSSIIEKIKQEKSFQKDGKFNQELYQKILTGQNLKEKDLLQNVADMTSKSILLSFLENNINTNSHLLAEELYGQYYQDVYFDLIKLSPSSAINFPTDQELVEYYNNHKAKYKTKASRDIEIIDISSLTGEAIENLKEEVYGGESIEQISKSIKLPIQKFKLNNEENITIKNYPEDIIQSLTSIILKADKKYLDVFVYDYKNTEGSNKQAAFAFEVTNINEPQIQPLEQIRPLVMMDCHKEKQQNFLHDSAYLFYASLSDKREYPQMNNVSMEVEKNIKIGLNSSESPNIKLPEEVRDKIENSNDKKIITKVGDTFYLVNIFKRNFAQTHDQAKFSLLLEENKKLLDSSTLNEILVNSNIRVDIKEGLKE